MCGVTHMDGCLLCAVTEWPHHSRPALHREAAVEHIALEMLVWVCAIVEEVLCCQDA